MIYEFTKKRSIAVAEIEPQIVDIIENIPTPSIAVAEIEPQTVDIIEKQFTEKPSTAVADIKPKLIDYIHANENFVESELHNDVLVVHQKENLLALETIFNKQESFKNWVISTRQDEIAAFEKNYLASVRDLIYKTENFKIQEKRLIDLEASYAKERKRGGYDEGMRQALVQRRPLVDRLRKGLKESERAGIADYQLLVELKANVNKIILFDAKNVLDPLIIDFIQKNDTEFLAWRSENLNAWLKINGV